MDTEKLIDDLAVNVKGNKNVRNILVFTLSTCQWCKKCKAWLNERDVAYRYIDVDTIQSTLKSQLIDYILKKFGDVRISYPFMICDDDVVIGYNPGKYEELMKDGGK
jgi:arsenate reductase-like glutaredoxin family protein